MKRDNTTAAERVRKRAGRPRRRRPADIGQFSEIDLETLDKKLRTVQSELSEARDRYTSLYDSAPVGYITLNKEGKILEANLTAAAMLGIERRTLLNAAISKFVRPNLRKDLNSHLSDAFSHTGKQICEIEMRTRDGGTKAVRLEGIVSGRSSDRRFQTALIDITDLRKAENALQWISKTLELRVQQQTAHIRLQAEAIAHLGEGVLITEGSDWPESKIVFVNQAVRRITGYSAEELIGQPRQILFGSEAKPGVLKQIRERLSAGKFYQGEFVSYRKEGTPYDAEVFIVPLPDSIHRSMTFVSIHRDVTTRKKTEVQLEEYKKNLQRMSSELMLAEERERQRLSQDLHDSLGQALFNARVKLDRISPNTPALKEIAKTLEGVNKVVNTLTFELSPPFLTQFGVNAAIRWLARDITNRYDLTVDVNNRGGPVTLDPRVMVVLFRSVRELLINVAKHAETKLATVSLKTSRRTLQVEVEDHGKGFNLADQSRHVQKGHFGLFSVRERIEYLGGTFNIQSTPTKGTRATITFPKLRDE